MGTQVVIMQHSIFYFMLNIDWSSGFVLNPDPTNIDICVWLMTFKRMSSWGNNLVE